MKIVWTNQFAQLPDKGGGTRHFELASELYKRYNIKTTIIAGNKNYLSGEKVFKKQGCYNIGNVEFCVLDIAYRPGYVLRTYSWLEFAIKLWTLRDVFKSADLVIGSSPTIFGAYSTMKLAQKYKKTFILEVRDLWPEILKDSNKLSEKSPVYRFLDNISKKLYRNANHIITLSKGQKDHIKNYTKAPITVVYNGMSDGIVSNIENIEKYNGFNIVYAGALGYANDIETIVKTAEKMKHYEDIKFHILGGGPYRKYIDDAIKKGLSNIIYYGMMPKKEAFRIMKRCQVGLLTLRNIELFRYGVSPNKLFDYLSLGLYVVSTVKGEIEGIVKESEFGETVEPGNPDTLVLTIEKLYHRYLKHPEYFERQQGIDFVKANYSRRKMTEKIWHILENMKRS